MDRSLEQKKRIFVFDVFIRKIEAERDRAGKEIALSVHMH